MTSKVRGKVFTVDPATRTIEFVLTDGAMVQAQVWEVPSFFRWPRQQEWWTFHRAGSTSPWILGDRLENAETVFKVEQAPEGAAKINTSVIYTEDGHRLAVVKGAPTDGQILSWSAADDAWVPVDA